MSPVVMGLLVGVAGGIGAAVRLVVDGLARARLTSSYPIGTTLVNLTGSLLLGLLTGLTTGHVLPHPTELIVGTGFLGGYTTFSTTSVETVRLVENRRHLAAGVNAMGTLVAGTALAALGLALGFALAH